MFIDPMDGLYGSKFEAYEAGKRTGHEQAMRHIRTRMSEISAKFEKDGTPDQFRVAEECCAAMLTLWSQFEAIHGADFGIPKQSN